MNVVSFSLWGDNPKYTIGAIKNANLASTWYRGWEYRFYCDMETVPAAVIKQLESLPSTCVVELYASKEPHWSMFWRFYAAFDSTVDVMISRDTDSRFGFREAEAVKEWIGSGETFHIMRDNPQHGVPILGGMW